MLNWDEPLTPPLSRLGPRTPDAIIDASVPGLQAPAQPAPAAILRESPVISEVPAINEPAPIAPIAPIASNTAGPYQSA